MPRFFLAVFFGTLLAFYGNRLDDPMWSAYAPLLCWLALRLPGYRFGLLTLAAMLWANGLLFYHLDRRLDAADDFRDLRLEGRIVDLVERNPERLRFYLEVSSLDGSPARRPRRLRLNWYQLDLTPEPGETWRFEVRLKQPRGLLNPGGFDYARWLFSQGIDATGYVRPSPWNLRLEAAAAWRIDHWREQLRRAISRHCEDCRHVGLLQALTLGFRGEIDTADAQVLRDTGTAHLLAISGLHIGLAAWFGFLLGGLAWRCAPQRVGGNRPGFATLVGNVAALAYAALAGFSLPTQRAIIMLTIASFALLVRRRVNLLHTLCLALSVILLLDPRATGSASFWLTASALAVIGLGLFRWPGALRWWQRLLAMQLMFSLLLAPLGLLLFEQINSASLLANLVAIPLVSFVVLPSILLACLLMTIYGPLAALMLNFADAALGLLLSCLGWLTGIGFAALPLYRQPLPTLMALFAVALLLMPLGRIRISGLALLLPMFAWQPARLGHGEWQALVLDVGQGTSVLLRTRHHSLVYDFGPGRAAGAGAVDWALLPALRRYAITSPDRLVVSHVDQDHSGGLHAYLRRHPDAQLLSGTVAELRTRFPTAAGVRQCAGLEDWRWDGVEFRFLATPGHAGSSNNRSCVLMVVGLHRLLLPGDIEAAQERRLLRRYGDALRADVLVAPHHGSKTSSSRAFVNRVAPELVVYTLAHRNRWGFPAAAVTARYRQLDTRQLRSDLDGAIRLWSRADGLDIKTLRHPPKRLWRQW